MLGGMYYDSPKTTVERGGGGGRAKAKYTHDWT